MRTEFTSDELAERILKYYHIVYYNKSFYFYEKKEGYWGYYPYDFNDSKRIVHDFCKENKKKGADIGTINDYYLNQILNYVARDTFVADNMINPYIIAVNNGLLDIGKYPPTFTETNESTYDIFSPLRIPVTYNPKIKECPKIDAFLNQITTDNSGTYAQDKNDVPTLYEMIGYALEPSYFIHKCAILTGSGHNGKTIYYNILSNFLGDDNVTINSMYELGKFDIINFKNKFVNIKADIGTYRDLPDVAREKIKELSGEEHRISSQIKHAPEIVMFKNRAKLYFGCNADLEGHGLPGLNKRAINDITFMNRWIILHLPNKYPEKAGFINLLISRDELSGLLNKALEGLNRLRKQKMFSKSKTQGSAELIEVWNGARIYRSGLVDEKEILHMPQSDSKDFEPLKLPERKTIPTSTQIEAMIGRMCYIYDKTKVKVIKQPKKTNKDKSKKTKKTRPKS